jgi:hypothetical protein
MGYRDDPRMITARYAGTDANGRAFAKGARVFYYPRDKRIISGEAAEQAERDFAAAAADEDFYNR